MLNLNGTQSVRFEFLHHSYGAFYFVVKIKCN